jgi:hypothetical protein
MNEFSYIKKIDVTTKKKSEKALFGGVYGAKPR